jgi:DNA polymerase III delta prime subunit
MERLPVLKDELAFLEKQLPQVERRSDLTELSVEFKKRIEVIRQQIKAIQETNETDRRSKGIRN